MSTLARTDNSILARWWWTVDRWNLAAIGVLAAVGGVLALAASPPVADRLDLETFHFARRQFLFLGLGLALVGFVSLLSVRGVQRLSILLTGVSMAAMVAVLFIGPEIKGATRWLQIGGFTFQPSEFVKPALAVLTAWLLAAAHQREGYPGRTFATAVFLAVAVLLLLQPDVGMTLVVSSVWAVQLFLAGLPIIFVVAMGALFLGGSVAAYLSFDHVKSRVDRFLDPQAEGYQVGLSLDAFRNGGLTGRGPGEGRVKELLPDAHTDFIFAVAGEEFGMFACLAIVAVFAFVVLRGFERVLRDENLFVLLAAAGLLVQFAIQAMINLASTLHLIPPKGMTLPFVSYGGSSTLAIALGLGMILSLTRVRSSAGGSR